MERPHRLESSDLDAWCAAHPGWDLQGTDALVRTFAFADFASALAFVVRIGCHAEKRDHHPDVELGWGRARVRWSTHDAGGITSLDLELAELSDTLTG
jgi:4a-hydroxytetrahydrobiopterin dehydratase